MKTSRIVGTLAAVVAGLGIASVGQARQDLETREIMQHKLQHTQFILKAIALQDFASIQSNASQLVKLSQMSGWKARQTPEYALFSLEFRRHAESLVKAAKAGNIDAATLAYTQLTFSCVSCHKHLRGDAVGTKGG